MSHSPDVPSPDEAAPTLVEEAAGLPTLVESVIDAQPPQEGGLAVGGSIGRYRLLKPLKVLSTEADIWVVAEDNDPERTRILKLYRYGLEPKAEITQALLELRAEHIVPVLATGHYQERYYEVQEFLREGSIADALATGTHGPEFAAHLLGQLTEALGHLHNAQILHRDIKPANLLVRSWHPFDLVLTDFGISSLAGLSLHLTTVNRTAAYSAPEALTGVVAKASDWWSVGVILVEALTGRHPFDGMSEQAINFQLVSKGLPIPSSIEDRWRLLLRGLLVRNHRKRWGVDQVRAWRAGDDSLKVPREEDPFSTLQRPSHRTRPYHFKGQQYETPEELAAALAEAWNEALKHFNRGFVTDWVRSDLRNQDLASMLIDIAQDPDLSAEERLIVALMALNSEMPPVYRSEIINPDWFVQNPFDAVNLLRGGVLRWFDQLHPNNWMHRLRSQRREGIAYLRDANLQFDQNTANSLLFSEKQAVIDAAKQLRERYVEAREPKLNQLLLKQELDFHEAVLLLAAHRGYYRTWQQVQEKNRQQFMESVESRFHAHHIPYDRDRLRELIDRNHDLVIQEADDYRHRYVKASKIALTRLMQKTRLELLDAMMLLAAKPDLFLDEANARRWEANQISHEMLQRLEETGIDLDWPLIEQLLAEPERLPKLVRQHQRRYTRAQIAKLEEILHKAEPDTFESLLLVGAQHRYFLSPGQAFQASFHAAGSRVLRFFRRYPLSSAFGLTAIFFPLVWVLPYYVLLPVFFVFLFTYLYAAVSAPPDQADPRSPYYRGPRTGPSIPPPPPPHLRRKPKPPTTSS